MNLDSPEKGIESEVALERVGKRQSGSSNEAGTFPAWQHTLFPHTTPNEQSRPLAWGLADATQSYDLQITAVATL